MSPQPSPQPTQRSTQHLGRGQARRIALAAQGFADRPHGTVTMRTLQRTVERTGVLQVDSVNVLTRAHYMPLYARMGPYDTGLLHRAAEQRPRRLVEYWAHVQAYMPVELWPLMAHRRAHYRELRGKWWHDVPDDVLEAVRLDVAAHGPSTAREVSARLGHAGERSKEHWGWNWSVARKALDHLYSAGEVAVAGRTSQFEVRYDALERVLPADVLAAPDVAKQDAVRALVERAARSHGVGTAVCLRDYYRLGASDGVPQAIADLVEDGVLEPVTVEGWSRPAYRHRDAVLPRRMTARTLLSPFDPVVWERERALRLFGFEYRIEIYTPAAKRRYGYYVLPFLLGEHLVARVDLKADRAASVLLVQSAHGEEGSPVPAGEVAEELAAELERLAGWLGLGDVAVVRRGDLAEALALAVASR